MSAKTVTVLFLHAHNINRWDKIILSRTQRDKTVLSPGQDFVPGTKQFCPRDKILSLGQDPVWVWVFQVELNRLTAIRVPAGMKNSCPIKFLW